MPPAGAPLLRLQPTANASAAAAAAPAALVTRMFVLTLGKRAGFRPGQRVYHPASRLANRARAGEAVYGRRGNRTWLAAARRVASRAGFLTSPVRSVYTPVQEFTGLKPRPHTY